MAKNINRASERLDASNTDTRQQLIRLALALVVLLGIAGVFILVLAWPLLTGTTIVLATAPVDPFDIFRGQYIAIAYEIATIPTIADAKTGDTVYVSLKPDVSNIWRYVDASLMKPRQGVFIVGEVVSVGTKDMRITYGIEQYFFERGARFSTQNMTVEAKVSANGKARISQLLQNGKPLQIDYDDESSKVAR